MKNHTNLLKVAEVGPLLYEISYKESLGRSLRQNLPLKWD